MTATSGLRPIDDSLFTWPSDEPRLRGSRCADCAWREFPFTGSCGRCGQESVTEYLLPPRGTVWSFTTQEFALKPPYVGEPGRLFALGYVDFDGLAVEGHFTTPVDQVRERASIGTAMKVVVVPFSDGVVTYAFEPVGEGER